MLFYQKKAGAATPFAGKLSPEGTGFLLHDSPPRGRGRPLCPETQITVRVLLHVVLVRLDHLLDHLAAHRTGLLAGQVAVVALLQVDAHLP